MAYPGEQQPPGAGYYAPRRYRITRRMIFLDIFQSLLIIFELCRMGGVLDAKTDNPWFVDSLFFWLGYSLISTFQQNSCLLLVIRDYRRFVHRIFATPLLIFPSSRFAKAFRRVR